MSSCVCTLDVYYWKTLCLVLSLPGYYVQPGKDVQLCLYPGCVVLEDPVPGPVLAPPLGQGLHTVAGQPLGQYLTDQHFIFQYLLFFNLLESKVLHAVTKKKISFVSLLKKMSSFKGLV